MKINLSHGRTSAHNIHTPAPRETELAGREENERKGGERDDGRGERMTGRGGAVITRRQLRNDGRGEEEMYEKMEIKEGEAETWRANRHRAGDQQEGGAVRRCYHTGRDLGKCSTAERVVKWNSEKSR